MTYYHMVDVKNEDGVYKLKIDNNTKIIERFCAATRGDDFGI